MFLIVHNCTYYYIIFHTTSHYLELTKDAIKLIQGGMYGREKAYVESLCNIPLAGGLWLTALLPHW